jgi:hypothetical protein
MLKSETIHQIRTNKCNLYAFRITGRVTRDDMEDMGRLMNDVFDNSDKVDMLLIFDRFDGAETGASLGWESLKSRVRSVTNVRRYVVAGAPGSARGLIEAMGKLLPVEAETFANESAAWRALDAQEL